MSTTMSATRKFWDGRPVLYRLYDVDGRLIYIGSTSHMPDRIGKHRHQVWWLPLVAKMRVEIHPTIAAARQAEREAIIAEKPAYNIKHTGSSWSWGDRERHAELSLRERAVMRKWQELTGPWPWSSVRLGRHLRSAA